MADIDYERMARILTRCAELAEIPGIKASIKSTYDGVLKPVAEAFLGAERAVLKAESAFAKENKEALEALALLDQPYREARSVVKAFVPTIKVPATLKTLKTDTDRLNAIEALLDIIDDYVGAGWADEQLQGEFGKHAAQAVKEVGEAIAANRGLDEARKARSSAFGPAYDAYLRFKRVVRDAQGAKSKEYKRIHLRSPAAGESGGEDEGGGEGSGEGGEGGES